MNSTIEDKTYAEGIDTICQYINANLQGDLSLEILSQKASFSKFHFHRQFSEYMGISVHRFIQMARLKYASYQLVFQPDVRIIDIAYDAGFENPESFSRAFKQTFGHTPSQFRKKPDWQNWHAKYQFSIQKWSKTMDVNITQVDRIKVAVLEHIGPPERINDSALKFIHWRKESGLSPVGSSKTYGIPYQDPKAVPPEEFRFDICGSVKSEVPDNPQGIINKDIPGGRCAVLRHKGSHDQIGESVHYLYGKWLPQSGEALRDFPCYFQYLNLFPEVEEHELLTDIYLPLK